MLQAKLTRRTLLALLVPAAAAHAQPATRRTIDLTIAEGRVSGPELVAPARGAPTLRLRQGEAVDLRWSTDRALDLHLHGLRIEARAEPDRPAITTVSARSAGRFAVETHDTAGRHATILYIEIHPR